MASLIRFSIGGRQEWLDKIIGNLVIESASYTMPDGTVIAPGVMTAGLTFTTTALASTSTDGLVLQNTTVATGTATVQMSPRLRWVGNAWDTAANQTVAFFAEVLPATAATPTGTWKLGYSLNGAAATYPLTVSSAGVLTILSSASIGNAVNATGGLNITGKWKGSSPADGIGVWTNNAATTGFELKADALPTVNSGSGTGIAVTAGSTPLAGSVNVGTGAPGTVIVIDFNGTAFPSAPFVIVQNNSSAVICKATASTTQLTITGSATFTASDVISWHCISSK